VLFSRLLEMLARIGDGMDVDDGTMRDDEEKFGRRAAFTPFRDVSQNRG
jgi:hypothetical protein